MISFVSRLNGAVATVAGIFLWHVNHGSSSAPGLRLREGNRNYSATLAAAVKNWFWGFLGPGKIPRDYVLEAESSYHRHGSTNYLEKNKFF
jgi:hypothetical protein